MGGVAHLTKAEHRRLLDEINEWRECAQYDATMEGPVFKGWNRSHLDRCRKQFIEATQTHKPQS